MSSWIEEEGQAFFRERKEAEHRKNVIAKSDFWSRILVQIKSDVECINQDANWKHALDSEPLKIEGIESGGIRIRKSRLTAAHLSIVGDGESVKVELQQIRKTDGTPQTVISEILQVTVSDDSVVLTDGIDQFDVPEGVSKFALMKLLDFMRTEYLFRGATQK